ncbi:MAG: Holliday junction branch migration DNA helicase RuvB [Christensenellales bacterium]|jgi:Holliday junction DNA helicase RuvB|nr:Holliday junction branch migration DNA helicase RuvB [Clostridiales bacterium]
MKEEDSRIISAAQLAGDDPENILRPLRLTDFIGQEDIKSNLNVFIKAALNRKEALDHVLLYGPPGLGKTTLSQIIANELGVEIKKISAPSINSIGELASILTALSENSVLFIDEIHRLNATLEEALYPVMEDFKFDMFIGKGPSARSLRMSIPKFTLVGATTKAGNIASPLRDRFGIDFRLDIYNYEELTTIIKRSAKILDIKIDDDAAIEIAKRSRGTPRIANRLLKRVRDFANYKKLEKINLEITNYALEQLNIDFLGLDRVDKNILKTIVEKFDGGPVGLDSIAASSGEESRTIEEVYEPYLLQIGFIARTPRGRVCLKKAYEHLGLNQKPENPSLFDWLNN